MGGRKRWIAFAAGILLLASAAAALAQLANHSNLAMFVQDRKTQGIYVDANLEFIRQEPSLYLTAVWRSITAFKTDYVRQFVGTLGWLSVPLPEWLIWIYAVMLLVVAAASAGPILLRPSHRMLIGGITIASVLSTFLLLWNFETTTSLLRQVAAGEGRSPGVQGRYFIPFSFLALLICGVNNGFITRPAVLRIGKYLKGVVIIVVTASALAGLYAIGETYYANLIPFFGGWPAFGADSPQARYEGMLVRRPGASPEDGMVYIVWNGRRRWVLDVDWVRANGFRWPQDILVISPKELKVISPGPPIDRHSTAIPPSPRSCQSPLERRLVRRAGTTPEDGKIFIVLRCQKHWIMDGRWIDARGFNWSEDIKIVADADLAAIPAGEPIPPLP
jgi:hypothetical protein